jgi:nitroreductase
MKLQEAIKRRRTLKVLSQENVTVKNISDDVQEILEMGGKAPFHYINPKASEKDLRSLAPWRFYVLNGESCRKLADYFLENKIEGGKIIQMLRASQTLIQVTWTPEELISDLPVSGETNIEHIAATSAAVQNMLLTATALGYENYWSSGGALREDRFKEMFGIPLEEQLLASLFLFDFNTGNCKTKKGALRGRQGDIDDFSKTVNL